MEDILVSIITVSLNSSATIERTIKSVTGQTYKNIEYIIVDGGSTDSTMQIVERYGKEYDNISYTSEPDRGIYDAMNEGLSRSRGELIGILNSDDWYEKDAVERILEGYCENDRKPAVYYGFMGVYKDGLEKSCLFFHHHFLPENMINHPSCFVSRQIYDKYGTYDTGYRIAADYDLMLRLFYIDEGLFYPVYERIANFSLGGASASSSSEMEADLLRKKYGLMSSRKYTMRKIVRTVKKWLGY